MKVNTNNTLKYEIYKHNKKRLVNKMIGAVVVEGVMGTTFILS